MRTARIAEAVVKLLAPISRNVSFDFQQMSREGKSSAILKTIGRDMDCPHCKATVPANHGHACNLTAGVWTRSSTPL